MTRTGLQFLFTLWLAAASAFAQRGQIPRQLTFTPYHASGIYDVGETVGWTVTPGPVAPAYAYKWTIRRNNAVVLKEGKLDLSSAEDKIEITADQPEMIYLAVEAYADLAAGAATPETGTAPPPPRPHPKSVLAVAPHPVSREAMPAATPGFTPWALPSRRRKSGSRRRVPTTSTHSGRPNSPPRPGFPSTPS